MSAAPGGKTSYIA